MNDFDYDIVQKKRVARGAFAHVNRKRGKCRLPSDYLTAAQKKEMNGAVKTYNITRPMTADFAGMGKRLREAREKELMSQNDLALESGVAPSTISYIECGHSTASVWVLAHICDALGVSMQWMVYGRGRK